MATLSTVSTIVSMTRDFMLRTTIGDSTDQVLQKAGGFCRQTGELQGSGMSKLISVTAMDNCQTFAKTCKKVAYVALILTAILPFLFGGLTWSFAFSALTISVLTDDIEEIVRRFSKLDDGDTDLVPKFEDCPVLAARLEFMLRTTTFLKLVPIGWIEKLGSALDFIPSPTVS